MYDFEANRPVVRQDNPDSYQLTWTFQGSLTAKNVRQRLELAGRSPNGWECGHTYDCCGCWFSRSIDIAYENNVTIVTQRFLRNV